MPEILGLIKAAQRGNEHAMESLIKRFEPLIIKRSRLFGKLDEDCRQHLTLEFILAVNNFDLKRFENRRDGLHQLTGDFYTVGMILGHNLKGIGLQLGISTNLEATTAQYVDVRLERKQIVLDAYHKALHPQKGKESEAELPKKLQRKSAEMER